MSSKILSHRAALCNTVRRVAEEAGELVLRYFDGMEDIQADSKEDGSPVTQADREAEKLIEQRLLAIFPDIPMIGEETSAQREGFQALDHDYFWLVDPVDGTKEFIAGGNDFTVNIGLVHKGQPVLGVIYAPAKGEVYGGFTNEDGSAKAFRYFEDSKTEKDMRVRRAPKEGLTVMISTYYQGGGRMEKFLEDYKVAKMIRRSSSLKICAVASGKADIYPRFGKTCEWDTAAGDAILRASGGMISDLDGKPFTYGRGNPAFANPEFVAAPLDLFPIPE